MLRKLLIFWGMKRTRIAKVKKIEDILRTVQPYYEEIRNISLGSGQIHKYRSQLQDIYEKLGGITNNAIDYSGNVSYIVGKSKTLVAIWGQVPGFDSLTTKNFVVWTHPPEPYKLPHLRSREIRYSPSQFCDMVEELDKWVLRWPESNNGRVFANSFSDLCPGLPVGRIIDMIYNFELPDPRVDAAVGNYKGRSSDKGGEMARKKDKLGQSGHRYLEGDKSQVGCRKWSKNHGLTDENAIIGEMDRPGIWKSSSGLPSFVRAGCGAYLKMWESKQVPVLPGFEQQKKCANCYNDYLKTDEGKKWLENSGQDWEPQSP